MPSFSTSPGHTGNCPPRTSRWTNRDGKARAYLLGDVVVKTRRPHRLRPRTSLAKEALLLKTLAEPLRHLMPHLYGHG